MLLTITVHVLPGPELFGSRTPTKMSFALDVVQVAPAELVDEVPAKAPLLSKGDAVWPPLNAKMSPVV